jgi:hypothetical protein
MISKTARHQSGICSLGGVAVELEIEMPQCKWVVRRRERFNANRAIFQKFDPVVEFETPVGTEPELKARKWTRLSILARSLITPGDWTPSFQDLVGASFDAVLPIHSICGSG